MIAAPMRYGRSLARQGIKTFSEESPVVCLLFRLGKSLEMFCFLDQGKVWCLD